MNDKEALQKIVYITNHYVNNTDWWKRDRGSSSKFNFRGVSPNTSTDQDPSGKGIV